MEELGPLCRLRETSASDASEFRLLSCCSSRSFPPPPPQGQLQFRQLRRASKSGCGGHSAELVERARRIPPPAWDHGCEAGRSASTARRRLPASPSARPKDEHGSCGAGDFDPWGLRMQIWEVSLHHARAAALACPSPSSRPRRQGRLPRRWRPQLTWGRGCMKGRLASTARRRLPTSPPARPQRQARLLQRRPPALRWSAREQQGPTEQPSPRLREGALSAAVAFH
jgi:hypothetical protein